MQRAEKRKFHYIYKTTCLITHRYYIGMHSTDNLEDGYVGSGQRLWHSIRKHGKENHKCEIIEFLDSRESLKNREREIVNKEALKDSQCMNLALGGEGGWELYNSNSDLQRQKCIRGNAKQKIMMETDPVFMAKKKAHGSAILARMKAEGKFKPCDWTGKNHSPESIEKMKASKQGHGVGSSNSQFGKVWMFSDELAVSKKISSEEIDVHIQQGWKRGRRMKM